MYKRPELNNQEIVTGHKDEYKIAFKKWEKLPSGANGIVYPAHTLKTQEKVAVKLFSPREETDEKKRERLYRLFKNDIKKIQSITHWNVVRIVDWGERKLGKAKIPFIVMEFIPWTLRGCFKKGLGLLTKIFYCAQLSDAVAYVNWRGRLIHRDIKPENILLTSDGLIKVTDLGIARFMPDFEKDMMAALNLYPESLGVEHPRHYFSPEQLKLARLQDEKKSDAELGRVDLSRSDIFQLGKVFHEIFTGDNPIGQINIMDEKYKETPKHLRFVIRGMLADDSDPRPPLEHCSCVLYVTLGLYLQEMLKKAKRLTRAARKDIADYFTSVDSFSMDREEAYTRRYDFSAHYKGLRELSRLGFVRVITSFDVSGSWSYFPKIEYKSSPDNKLTIALTSQGIDLRNMIMGNTDWKNFIDLYSKLCKFPTSRSLAYATRAFKKPPTEWQLNMIDRDVPEYSLLMSKKKGAFYYIFPLFSVGKRWWTEIHGSANLTETGARDPRVLHWGTGYDVPWCVVEAQTRRDVLKGAKELLQDGIPNEEVEKVVSNQGGLKPGRWVNVSRGRLLSYGFFDRLISDNDGRPIRLKVGDPEGPLSELQFKKVEVLEVEWLPTEEGPIRFDDLIKSIFAAKEISPSLETTIEGLFIRPVVINEKQFLPLFFGMVLSVCRSCECTIEFANGIWKISVALEGKHERDFTQYLLSIIKGQKNQKLRTKRPSR